MDAVELLLKRGRIHIHRYKDKYLYIRIRVRKCSKTDANALMSRFGGSYYVEQQVWTTNAKHDIDRVGEALMEQPPGALRWFGTVLRAYAKLAQGEATTFIQMIVEYAKLGTRTTIRLEDCCPRNHCHCGSGSN